MLYILFPLCYLIGSIPFGWLVGRIFYDKDIRNHGSGNIGASNALRVLGWKPGSLVFVLDFFKGLAILWLVPFIVGSEPSNLVWTLAGLLPIIGHLFPVWFWFKGGKAVATSAGVLAVLLTVELFIALGVFVIIVYVYRYISLGSILAAITMLISHLLKTSEWLASFNILFTEEELPITLFTAFVCLAVIYAHRENIPKLINGSERKFSFKKSPG